MYFDMEATLAGVSGYTVTNGYGACSLPGLLLCGLFGLDQQRLVLLDSKALQKPADYFERPINVRPLI